MPCPHSVRCICTLSLERCLPDALGEGSLREFTVKKGMPLRLNPLGGTREAVVSSWLTWGGNRLSQLALPRWPVRTEADTSQECPGDSAESCARPLGDWKSQFSSNPHRCPFTPLCQIGPSGTKRPGSGWLLAFIPPFSQTLKCAPLSRQPLSPLTPFPSPPL